MALIVASVRRCNVRLDMGQSCFVDPCAIPCPPPCATVYCCLTASRTTGIQEVGEEICILDHLSYGRMEVGVGRGVSPFELKYHKIDHDESRDIFIDAFNCIAAGLTADTLTYSGKYYQ